ncbi:hypothetical protein BJ165DRAFT_1521424 [Panaeolus papilionaceus]|nr:hypothetical protein BJ165DRAFT_1521424 [Panaeolus papilionaceus]
MNLYLRALDPSQPQYESPLCLNMGDLQFCLEPDLNDPTLVRQSLDWVRNGLADPNNPRGCAGSFYSAMGVVGMAEERKDGVLTSLQSEIQEMWSRVYKFIIHKRTDEQLAALSRKLSTCTCPSNDFCVILHTQYQAAIQHDSGPGTNGSFHRGRGDMWRFLYSTCRVLRLTMNRSKELSVVKGVSKKWPSSSAELLPFGADNTVQTLIQYDRIVGDLATQALTHQLFKYCGGQVYDSFVKFDAFNLTIVEPVRRALDKALEAVENAIANKTLSQLRWGFHLEQLVPTFYHCISEVFRPPVRKNLLMFNGGETKVVQLLSIIVYLLPHFTYSDPRMLDTMATQTAEYCRHVFRTWGMHLPGRPNIPVHPAVVERDRLLCASLKLDADRGRRAPNKVAEEKIARAMHTVHLCTPCSAPGCSLTIKDASSFKLCAECTVVGYCGRDCQAKDWKNEAFPHKSVCSLLRKIIDELEAGWKVQSKDSTRNILGSRWPPASDKDTELLQGLADGVAKARQAKKISVVEFRLLQTWAERTMNQIHVDNLGLSDTHRVLDSKFNPGYDDYEQLLARLTNPRTLKGPKAVFINRNVKWPPV